MEFSTFKPGISRALISGCFDHLHRGHLHILTEIQKHVQHVTCLVNSDGYIIRKKGRQPLVDEKRRLQNILDTRLVDHAFVFDEDTPLKWILLFKPDFLVCGNDYDESQIVGLKEGVAWGCRAIVVPRLAGFSTTGLIKQKNNLET